MRKLLFGKNTLYSVWSPDYPVFFLTFHCRVLVALTCPVLASDPTPSAFCRSAT